MIHAKSSWDDFNESAGAVVLMTLCPCALCCNPLGKAASAFGAGDSGKLSGLPAVLSYVTTCRETNATYFWSIQNYHMETRTRTVSDGKGGTRTETYQQRVNTHYAQTSGTLATRDLSKAFVPHMRKRNCALRSNLVVRVNAEYERRKAMFYAANRRDVQQEYRDIRSLPGLKETALCEWADDGKEDPCWASQGCCILSTITCSAVCWFMAMRDYMAADSYTFDKDVLGFIS